MPEWVPELLTSCSGLRGKKTCSTIWGAIPTSIMEYLEGKEFSCYMMGWKVQLFILNLRFWAQFQSGSRCIALILGPAYTLWLFGTVFLWLDASCHLCFDVPFLFLFCF